MPRVILILLPAVLALYATVDCLLTPKAMQPGRLPKLVWVGIIIFLPLGGPVAWIVSSRLMRSVDGGGNARPSVWSAGSEARMPRPGTGSGGFLRRGRGNAPQSPDDDTEFLDEIARSLQRQKWEQNRADAAASESGGETGGELGNGGQSERGDGEQGVAERQNQAGLETPDKPDPAADTDVSGDNGAPH